MAPPSPQTNTRTVVAQSAARSVVYSAPELLEGLLDMGASVGSTRTREADVYAFAMVLLELFVG